MGLLKITTKGILISFMLHLVFAFVIVQMDFDMSMENFSVLLIILMSVISFYVGLKSGKMGPVVGILISLGTVGILLLYLNQRIEMDWELNRYLIGIYLLDGFVFSFLGMLMQKERKNRKTKKEKQKILKKQKKVEKNA